MNKKIKTSPELNVDYSPVSINKSNTGWTNKPVQIDINSRD